MSKLTREDARLVRSYIVGFVLSVGLTTLAFVAAMVQQASEGDAFSSMPLVVGLVVLAITQLIVQLLFFFHLGHESRPRLNTVSFLFMVMVISIIGFGSLWIMYNLDYNMMTPAQVDSYIQEEEGIYMEKHEGHYEGMEHN